jgi:hypothetical protein
LLDRGEVLLRYQVVRPALSAALAASVMRGVMALLALVLVAWGLSILVRRLGAGSPPALREANVDGQ